MKYYIDLTDKRNVFLKDFLEKQGKEVIDYSKIIKHTVFSSTDCFVFSPAKKFDDLTLKMLPNGTTLICGAITQEQKNILDSKGIRHINLLKDENYAVKNAMLTAEGVLSIILEKNEKSIYDNKILILGAGRVAKACALLFKSLNLDYAIASYNKEKFSENNFFSRKSYLGNEFWNDIEDFDVIINSIPAKIISDEDIKKIAPNSLFIETASTQCLNKELATHFNYVLAPGLPQKYCASSAGKLMMENILGDKND